MASNKRNLQKKLILRIMAVAIIATASVGSLLLFGPTIGSLFGMISVNRRQEIRRPEANTPPPVFIDVPTATNKTKINIQGVSAPKKTVELYVNGPKKATVLTDMAGEFLFVDVELIKGKNTIFAKVDDSKSDTIKIDYDNEPPKIEITSPEDGDKISNLNERIEIEGTIDERATVVVNGRTAIQRADNSFSFLLGVEEGEIEIAVKATDRAGNQSEKTITVEYRRK
jgi:hypothetical protein